MISDEAFDARWAKIVARTEAIKRVGAAKKFSGSWENRGVPVKVELLAPAPESLVASIEDRLGMPIPASLRQIYTRGTAGLVINWLIPGDTKVMPAGWQTVEYDYKPPEPFEEINGGSFYFRLTDVLDAQNGIKHTIDYLAEMVKADIDAGDPDGAEHYALRQRIWGRCFGWGSGANGDTFAIDPALGDEVCNLFHEMADEPAHYYGKGPLEFIEAVSKIGFVAIDWSDLIGWATEPGEDMTDGLDPDWLAKGYCAPGRIKFDPDNARSRQWRDWLGDIFPND